MAGQLPGVECARRRRSGGWSDAPASTAANCSTRRSSFCLYATAPKIESHHLTSSSCVQRNAVYQAYQDERLGGVAREAKDRLDERLKPQKKKESHPERQSNGVENPRNHVEGRSHKVGVDGIRTELLGSEKKKKKKKKKKKNGSKRFSWARLMMGRKAPDRDECAACLDWFQPEKITGAPALHLPLPL